VRDRDDTRFDRDRDAGLTEGAVSERRVERQP
jgi:hypothetical protein